MKTTDILSRCLASRGILGILAASVSMAAGLDVRVWINGQILDLGNAPAWASLVLAAYGRLNAKGPILAPKPPEPAA